MWTLTYVYNSDDNQDECLITVFSDKPTASELSGLPLGVLSLSKEEVMALLDAGSYQYSSTSYYLREVTSGEINPSITKNWR